MTRKHTQIVDGFRCILEHIEDGWKLSIFMRGDWHEAPVMPSWSEQDVADAIHYLEERLYPGSGQHLAMFMPQE